MKINKVLQLGLISAPTLGLAPFNPPHIVGKIQWIMGGAKGMKLIDWWDVVLHGTPWLLLLLGIALFLKNKEYQSSRGK